MKRKDGRKIKTIEPILKIFPYFMPERCDSQIFAKEVIQTEEIDKYLKERRKEGLEVNFLHLLIAVFVRVFAERPRLNRFIINRETYARNNIQISMTIKKSLKEEAPETVVKFTFDGTENLEDVVRIVNSDIKKALAEDDAEVEKIASSIAKLPAFIKGIASKFILFLDNHGMLPLKVIEASPFHASAYVTYLKSIKQEFIYHHLYNLGTAGLFVAIGKIVDLPVVVDGEVQVKKCCEIGYTADERICDGLYLATSLRRGKQLFENPHLLETRLEKRVEDVE